MKRLHVFYLIEIQNLTFKAFKLSPLELIKQSKEAKIFLS